MHVIIHFPQFSAKILYSFWRILVQDFWRRTIKMIPVTWGPIDLEFCVMHCTHLYFLWIMQMITRLYYEVSKRAYRELTETWDRPVKRNMKIQCFRQVCAGQRQTDNLTPWAPDGANKYKSKSTTRILFVYMHKTWKAVISCRLENMKMNNFC